ncbi:MAG: cellulase family glycosylhydrolase [Bacteroidetes bacterium]|nr:cellulase family glycosylhydrolase [Bacteroidota bacterium]
MIKNVLSQIQFKTRKIVFTAITILFTSSFLHAEGFLKVSGTLIVDGSGKEFQLRGMGLGGWMLPEGYMFQMSAFANAPWEIKKKIVDVVGVQKADTFWNAFRKNFVQRKDVERLAQQGFNSIRLPMHWEFYMNPDGTFRQEGFVITDSLLRWCADSKVYLILDLHGAPGGQSANNISDYNPAYPSLWQSETNKQMTIALWKELALRYKNEQWIGGYDILNEPAWDLPPSNKPLRDLSVAITSAIRSVDTTHIVFVEGNWYATDFGGMTPAWDANMVWSFHKYWNANDIGAINYLLTLRTTTNRPLWLGESGENSNTWFTDCISLLEDNSIGWCWWTIKKFGAINGPFSVPVSPEFDLLLRYWKGQTSKPSVDYAMNALMGMAEGLKLEKCVYNSGVIDAMFRQVHDQSLKPFAANTVPGNIFTVDYDYGRYGLAYKDAEYHNINNNTTWNNGWLYRNDGVDIEKCNDAVTNGYNVGWTSTGEFMYYTVNVQQSGKYSMTLRAAVNDAGGYIGTAWDSEPQSLVALSQSGGWQSWADRNLGEVTLSAGLHKLRLSIFFGGFNLNYLKLTMLEPMSVEGEQNIPSEFSLAQNYPNPFNPSTTILYTVGMDARPSSDNSENTSSVSVPVSLKVYDILGHEITTLVNEQKTAGAYSVVFNADKLPSGIYYYTLNAGKYSSTKKMIVMK